MGSDRLAEELRGLARLEGVDEKDAATLESAAAQVLTAQGEARAAEVMGHAADWCARELREKALGAALYAGALALVAAIATPESVGRVVEQLGAAAKRAVHWAQAEAIHAAVLDIQTDPQAVGVWARVFGRMAKRRAAEHPEFAAVYEAAAMACTEACRDGDGTEGNPREANESEEQKTSAAGEDLPTSPLGRRASGVAW